jgi:hypothetical protein
MWTDIVARSTVRLVREEVGRREEQRATAVVAVVVERGVRRRGGTCARSFSG